ncbi:hypothetical protein SAMN00790413_00978 [Deinococcus hopiensis KR-140]|uniref:Uncharacterized protein n=1 Tax=Deinococcus hopiensis KR-140 TaxID=695939 RepID=A0A1W1VD09_9DEIO|nr:hypothetical protein SAMN00790413_00978 [Deinococcus hopiensis KR-140]
MWPRAAQFQVRDALAAQGWRLDACEIWNAPIEAPAFQAHARHPDLPGALLLDLMLSDLEGGLWRYRRAPRVTLPLERARHISPEGLPHLVPETVPLFKSGAGAVPGTRTPAPLSPGAFSSGK